MRHENRFTHGEGETQTICAVLVWAGPDGELYIQTINQEVGE